MKIRTMLLIAAAAAAALCAAATTPRPAAAGTPNVPIGREFADPPARWVPCSRFRENGPYVCPPAQADLQTEVQKECGPDYAACEGAYIQYQGRYDSMCIYRVSAADVPTTGDPAVTDSLKAYRVSFDQLIYATDITLVKKDDKRYGRYDRSFSSQIRLNAEDRRRRAVNAYNQFANICSRY